MTILDESADAGPRRAEARPLVERVPRAASGRAGESDRRLERALRLIDPVVAESFTAEQRRAIRTMLGLRGERRPLFEWRGGFGLTSGRYFLTLYGGRERRAARVRPRAGLRRLLSDSLPPVVMSVLLLALLFVLAAGWRG